MRLLSSAKVSKVTEIPQVKQHLIRIVANETGSLWKGTQNQTYSQKETRFVFLSMKFLKGMGMYKYLVQVHRRAFSKRGQDRVGLLDQHSLIG